MNYIRSNHAGKSGTNRATQAEISSLLRHSFPGRVTKSRSHIFDGLISGEQVSQAIRFGHLCVFPVRKMLENGIVRNWIDLGHVAAFCEEVLLSDSLCRPAVICRSGIEQFKTRQTAGFSLEASMTFQEFAEIDHNKAAIRNLLSAPSRQRTAWRIAFERMAKRISGCLRMVRGH